MNVVIIFLGQGYMYVFSKKKTTNSHLSRLVD